MGLGPWAWSVYCITDQANGPQHRKQVRRKEGKKMGEMHQTLDNFGMYLHCISTHRPKRNSSKTSKQIQSKGKDKRVWFCVWNRNWRAYTYHYVSPQNHHLFPPVSLLWTPHFPPHFKNPTILHANLQFQALTHHNFPPSGISTTKKGKGDLTKHSASWGSVLVLVILFFTAVMPPRRYAFGRADEATHPDSIRATLAEFISTFIFVFAGEGSVLALGMTVLQLFWK